MKAKVTEQGLLIPREIAEHLGSEEAEISEQPDGRLLVVPAGKGRGEDPTGRGVNGKDPILSLGEDPVEDEITDASVNHDRYIYGA